MLITISIIIIFLIIIIYFYDKFYTVKKYKNLTKTSILKSSWAKETVDFYKDKKLKLYK